MYVPELEGSAALSSLGLTAAACRACSPGTLVAAWRDEAPEVTPPSLLPYPRHLQHPDLSSSSGDALLLGAGAAGRDEAPGGAGAGGRHRLGGGGAGGAGTTAEEQEEGATATTSASLSFESFTIYLMS